MPQKALLAVASVSLVLVAGAPAGAGPAASPAAKAGSVLSVSRSVAVPGQVVRARVRIARATTAASCSLVAHRVPGPGRHSQGRARVVSSVARWRVDTSGWRTGRWRMTATCRAATASRTIRVVPPPGPPPASASFTEPEITMSPGLSPSFRSKVQDYVVRCTPGVPVQVDVVATAGTWVSVDRGRWRSGSFSRSVPLDPGERFLIRVSGGTVDRTTSVRCLPPDFPTLVAQGTAPDGWYAFTLSYLSGSPFLIVVDEHGTPVWWYRDQEFGNPIDLGFWTHDQLAAFGWDEPFAFSWAGGMTYLLTRADGSEVHRWGNDLDRHDLVPTSRGTVLTIRYVKRDCPRVPSACVDMSAYGGGTQDVIQDAEIVELAPNGTVVWRWSSKGHIAIAEAQRLLDHPSEPLRNADGSWDLVHLNSVAQDGNGLVFSARHLDAVYRISRSTGDVSWKVGGTTTPQSLSVLGSSVSGLPLAMQHDARVLSDRTVTVYDNGTTSGRPPRMVRFAIDVGAGTATEVASLGDARVPNSGYAGSARPIRGGDWLMAWGGTNLITVNRPDGTPVFTLSSTLSNGDKGIAYRAVPISPMQLPASALRNGMDTMHPRT